MSGVRVEGHYRMKTPSVIIFGILTIFLVAEVDCAADSGSVPVTATVISRGACSFTTHNSTLGFGNLDPSNPVDAAANTSVSFRCFGFFSPVTYYIDDVGSYDVGNAHRMRHASVTTAYLPYSLTLNPRSGTISWNPFIVHPVAIVGTVRGVDYQDAVSGAYSDTVTMTIVP